MTVGERLRAMRLRAGVTVRAAATAAGMKTPSNWQHYEATDAAELPADLIIRLIPAWEGLGAPPITRLELLEFSPILRTLYQDNNFNITSTVGGEVGALKATLSVDGKSIEDVQRLVNAFSTALAKLQAEK